jgi:hypothetical protein
MDIRVALQAPALQFGKPLFHHSNGIFTEMAFFAICLCVLPGELETCCIMIKLNLAPDGYLMTVFTGLAAGIFYIY